MTEKQIVQLLKDYHWMINSVKIMREGLNDVGGTLRLNMDWRQLC